MQRALEQSGVAYVSPTTGHRCSAHDPPTGSSEEPRTSSLHPEYVGAIAPTPLSVTLKPMRLHVLTVGEAICQRRKKGCQMLPSVPFGRILEALGRAAGRLFL